MKRILAGATVVVLALSASGCAASFDTSHLGVTATMAEPAQAPASGNAFRVTRHPVYLMMGLIPLGRTNLEDLLAGQLANGASIASLKIHVRSRFSDVLITALTLGIVAPRSVTYEGVVVGRPAAGQ
ncbi:MAG TPA: hypothetical protein VK547_07005 [Candidatus Udaeobacter sp.]|nr:hypothetical protein [Candidatus Udaeobacter sp.]